MISEQMSLLRGQRIVDLELTLFDSGWCINTRQKYVIYNLMTPAIDKGFPFW